MVTNLKELIANFSDEQKCRDFLVQQRWGGSPECPYCGSNKWYSIEGGKRFKCGNSKCYKKYSVTVGTIFHASNIPLTKWFPAMYILTAHKKGISSVQLAKDLGVTQKTAWFMNHRIRENLRDKKSSLLGGTVECDEVYIGGKVGNMSKTKRKQLRDSGNTYNTKTMVMGMLERGGNLKLVSIGSSNNINAIIPTVKDNVSEQAVLITDSLATYNGLSNNYAEHHIVNHSNNEYVKTGNIHTNSIEGAFSLLKRSIYGIYHSVSVKHLSRYCEETMFRYNLRGLNDADRFTYSLSLVEGRLTYKQLIAKKDAPEFDKKELRNANVKEYIKGKHREIVQLKDGIVINQFKSVAEAARVLGILPPQIRRVLMGKKQSTHGYQWKYL